MPARLKGALAWTVVTLVLGLSAAVFTAGTIVFGPETYTRGKGKPVEVKRKFTVRKPAGTYTLRVVNHGVTSATVELNGRRILDKDDFTVKRRDHGRDD